MKDETLDRILGFLDLGKDWDSYGADPIDISTVDEAMCFYSLLTTKFDWELPKCHVYPTANGGVQFEFECNGRELEVEAEEAGYYSWLMSTKGTNSDSWIEGRGRRDDAVLTVAWLITGVR